jgi:hypothetical protein
MNPPLACPTCRQTFTPVPLGFTWWGGMIGAKIINHCECPSCHTRFNGRTGKPNDTAILLYVLISGALIGLLAYMVLKR